MSTVKASYSGFISHDGIPVLLSDGDEYDAEHPLVKARPDLFSKPQQQPEPEPKASEAPAEPIPEPKRGPGRPPASSRSKVKGDG